MNKRHIGSDFDDFLREEQLFDAAEAAATKRYIAFQIAQAMKQRHLSKSEMASRMKTSRAAVERVLDPANTSITLATLGRAAAALGKRLRVEFDSSAAVPRTTAKEQKLGRRHRQDAAASRPASAPASSAKQASSRSEPKRTRR